MVRGSAATAKLPEIIRLSKVFMIFLPNVEAWHPLPGAPLRFRLRFVATLRLRLRAGSGLLSAALFDLLCIAMKLAKIFGFIRCE
jgi:hypothetical protein